MAPASRSLGDLVRHTEPLLLPGVTDALGALICARAGFEAVYLTGAGVTNSQLGMADLGLVTLPEMATQVERIREVVTLPIVVDADTGFGGVLNVRRTVHMLERRGANALQIEDQVDPKRCGHFAGSEVVPVGAMLEKLHAATDARSSEEFLIIGRTDANASLGIEAAIERAGTYLEHGADCIFVEAPRDEEEMARVARGVPGPTVVNMVEGGRTPVLPLARLAEMGFAVVLYANAALRAAMKGMVDVLTHLHAEGSTLGVMDRLVSWDERQALVGKDELLGLAEGYAAD